jgi:hypothetical protein
MNTSCLPSLLFNKKPVFRNLITSRYGLYFEGIETSGDGLKFVTSLFVGFRPYVGFHSTVQQYSSTVQFHSTVQQYSSSVLHCIVYYRIKPTFYATLEVPVLPCPYHWNATAWPHWGNATLQLWQSVTHGAPDQDAAFPGPAFNRISGALHWATVST